MDINEWVELLKKEIQVIHKDRPEWSIEKCEFLAKKNMPPFPKIVNDWED